MILHLDFETCSRVDLRAVGAWNYALHPSTAIMCMGYAWTGGEPFVQKAYHLKNFLGWAELEDSATVISAHNAHFEYAAYNLILHRRYGWPARWDPSGWRCTMARAAMCGLPLDLDSLGRVLQIKTPKDLDGRRVMHQLCKPRADGTFDEDPAKYERLYAYNRTDVMAEMEIDALLPELPASEQKVWEQDLVMNRRGVQLDVEFARKASEMSAKIIIDLNARLYAQTGGALSKASRVGEIKSYMASCGVPVPVKVGADGEDKETLDKVAILETLQKPDVPDRVRAALTVRQQAGKSTSTAKYAMALAVACPDGRGRGLLQYHAAHTGRWGGRLLQPQNFPKGFGAEEQAEAVALIKAGDVQAFTNRYGIKSMAALSDALRGLFIAAPGRVLIAADFNAIEARVLFWLADEKGALAAYRRGESPYVEMANYIYRRTDITKKGNPKEYDIGKRTILGAGFGLGAVKFKDSVYIETAKTGAPVLLDDDTAKRAIDSYREKYPGVKALWVSIEQAAILAVKNPARCYPAAGGRITWGMSKDQRFLVCKLPSGRFLWYWKPSVRVGKTPWGETKEEMIYWGQHPRTGDWCALKTYGGLLTENVVQAVARDLLVNGMLNCEAAGYSMLLSIHDELVGETGTPEDPKYRFDDFMQKMCALPPWADGCPVAAEGWIDRRYRK